MRESSQSFAVARPADAATGSLDASGLGFFGWRREQMPWQRLCAQRALVSGTTATTPVGRHDHAVSHAVTQLSVQLAADCGCVSRQIERDLTWISRVASCGRCCALALMHRHSSVRRSSKFLQSSHMCNLRRGPAGSTQQF